jgi:hypothetical protein
MRRAVEIIRAIYAHVEELEKLTGRRFTPDGHMVGSLGEVWAKWMYDLELLPHSQELHDARSKTGIHVQVKATQGRQVPITGEPEHLIVLRLFKNGAAEEVYNGPGALAWAKAGKIGKNGQRPLSLSTLRTLMNDVPESSRLPLVRQPREALLDEPLPRVE